VDILEDLISLKDVYPETLILNYICPNATFVLMPSVDVYGRKRR